MTTRAAIYVRKSTDQIGVSDDARSVTRQIDHARAFALEHDWVVDDAHIYIDDGVSGALFGDRRPGLLRLLNALRPVPPFGVLVMSEESRLGREMHQTAHVFGEIIRAGVRIWFYLNGRERTLDTAIDKMMLSLTTFSAELEREKARQRTRDAMLRKARAGHVTGGRVFGYDNQRTSAGHVERVINDAEAQVIRRIFALAATGYGLRAIAHTLNAEGAPAPRPQQGRPRGWAPSSVREVLVRPLYRGVIEWDRHRRDNERRQRKATVNADTVQLDAPQLRLVPFELAARVDVLRQSRRGRYLASTGMLKGGATPRPVKYLLAGMLRCVCGATYEAIARAYGRRAGGVYLCSAHRRKGASVCANDLHLPLAETDAAILHGVEQHILDPQTVDDALALGVAQLSDTEHRQRQRADHDRLTREVENLITLAAGGAASPTILAAIRERETQLQALAAALRAPQVDQAQLRATLEGLRDDWVRALRTQPDEGQRVLRAILDGPIDIGAPTAGGVPWTAHGPKGVIYGLITEV